MDKFNVRVCLLDYSSPNWGYVTKIGYCPWEQAIALIYRTVGTGDYADEFSGTARRANSDPEAENVRTLIVTAPTNSDATAAAKAYLLGRTTYRTISNRTARVRVVDPLEVCS